MVRLNERPFAIQMSKEKILLETQRFNVVEVPAIRDNPDGKKRQVVRHPGAVAILPMVDDDHICLIRNFRVSVNQPLVEIPAGTLEHEETPIETAFRELIEETGFRATNMQPIHRFLLSPGILDEWMHLFVATGLTQGDPCREEGEDIENMVVGWDQAVQMVTDQTITDAKSIVGILLYDQIRKARTNHA